MSLKFLYKACIGLHLILNINGFEFPEFEIHQISTNKGTADLGISEQMQGNETYTVTTHNNKTIQYTKVDGFWILEGCEIIGSDEAGFYGLGILLINGTWDDNDDESGDRRRLNPFENSQFARWPNGIIPVDRTNYPGGFPEQLWTEIVNEYFKVGITIRDWTGESDYVEIIDGSGCYADVGRFGGKQTISLQNPGCLRLNVAGIIYYENI